MNKTLDDWQQEIGSWGRRTFVTATPDSIVAHLKKEFKEFFDEQDHIARREEAADILHLLIQLAYRENWSLEKELVRKFEINKKRRWGVPDENGVVEHIDEDIVGIIR